MAKLIEVQEAIQTFLKSTFGVEGKIVGLSKSNAGWEAEAELSEIDKYYQTINPDYRIMQRNLYRLRLNEQLEVTSYARREERETEEE